MNDLNQDLLQEETSQQLLARARLFEECSPENSGLSWCDDHTAIVDHMIRVIYRQVAAAFPTAPPIAVIATGGYGRRELAPYSDIDLTVVPQHEESALLDDFLRTLYRTLHQVLGGPFRYELGYSFRAQADLPGLDPTSRTALLDARLAAGSASTFNRLMESFWESFPAGEFILTKISERKSYEESTNSTPLAVEPHIKEGRGGLRSFQCSNWIRAAIGERPIRPSANYEALISARNLLHLSAERRQDILTAPRMNDLTDRWGLDRDEFMEKVSLALLEGEKTFETVCERLHEARFSLSNSVEALRDEARIVPMADMGDAALGISIAAKLGIKIADFPSTYSDRINEAAALLAVGEGEKTLRSLDRCGLLEALLPELTACRTLLPEDSSHVYTVFEHTMKIIQCLDSASTIPYYSDLLGSLSNPPVLYLACLLHDIGKLTSKQEGRPHSDVGEEMARKVCERWGLGSSITGSVCWLVKEHLTMSHFMRLRDLDNPATISEFAEIVKTPERLFMLALLTWADISAVAPGAYTAGQEAFLKEIVSRTSEVLEGDTSLVHDSKQARKSLIKVFSDADADSTEIEAFLMALPAHYMTGGSPKQVERHYALAKEAKEAGLVVDAAHRPEVGATEVTICTPDRSGLLSELLGVFYAYDLAIGTIKAFTTSEETPMAIDIFTVSFSSRPVPQATWRQVSFSLSQVLKGEESVDELLTKKGKDPSRRQKLLRCRHLPGDPAILEFHTPKGRGMPFRLSRYLKEQGFNILSARVGQWAGAAAAAFYVRSAKPDVTVEDLVAKSFPEEANLYK